MLTGIHLLLTYACNLECDHCFLYSGPNAKGTFTLSGLQEVLKEVAGIGGVESVYFEGGEPFLFYPLMVEGIRVAREMGMRTGIVTNAYWATSVGDAELWLRPLAELEVSDLSLSDDKFHHGEEEENPARLALRGAKRLKMPVDTICIEEAGIEAGNGKGQAKGAPVVGGNVRFRGRAAEKLTEGLETRRWQDLTECPYEDLESPRRVHVDSYGNVQVCQGLSIGTIGQTSLAEIVKQYDPQAHPICGPLLRGGPASLAREYEVEEKEEYVDECHFCYLVRRTLIDRFPHYLAPKQVYGLQETG
jgi:MoaA/NifB/PqqE/SkfB family radical SAM enzyme